MIKTTAAERRIHHSPLTTHEMQVLILQPRLAAEFEPVGVCLERDFAGAVVRRVADVASALREAEAGRHPELIVVCQSWPDEYTPSDVRRLLASFPLARLVCCYGSWCASDGRGRDIWPAAVRVPAAEAQGRLRRERDVLVGKRPPLPVTAGRDEIYEFDFARLD